MLAARSLDTPVLKGYLRCLGLCFNSLAIVGAAQLEKARYKLSSLARIVGVFGKSLAHIVLFHARFSV